MEQFLIMKELIKGYLLPSTVGRRLIIINENTVSV